MDTFGERLKQLRIEKNFTQEKFGEIWGLKKSRISQYELNKRPADDELKKQFSHFFNVSIDYLLGHTKLRTLSHYEYPFNEKNSINPELKKLIEETSNLSYESQKMLTDFVKLLKIKDMLDRNNSDTPA